MNQPMYLFLLVATCFIQASIQTNCIDGQYTLSGTGCLSCTAVTPAGTKWSFNPGTNSISACVAYGCTGQLMCGSGTYSVAGGGTCGQCASGTYSLAVGASSSTTCSACPVGHSCATTTGVPVPCGTGKWSPGNLAVCNVCGSGTFSAATTAAAISTCVPCASGQHSTTGSATCTPFCPPGLECFDDTTRICPAGTYSLGTY